MNIANVSEHSDDLNELPDVQYVLIEKKKQRSEPIFLYSAFNIPIKIYTTETPLG